MTSRPRDIPTIPTGSIVVGVDGSVGALAAVRWAAQQASCERRPVVLVHGLDVDTVTAGDSRAVDAIRMLDYLWRDGLEALEKGREVASAVDPDLAVTTEIVGVDARHLLLDLGERAAMVIVGSRGRGPVRSLLLGSVSVALSRHAAGPLVIVRPHHEGLVRRGIVVGTDATAASSAAVEFAYRLASERDLPLTVLHLLPEPAILYAAAYGVYVPPPDLVDVDAERAVLAESLAGLGEKFPDVHTNVRLERGGTVAALVEASRKADVLVVGAHHGGRGSELWPGSVATGVVERAGCPVAVVPQPVG